MKQKLSVFRDQYRALLALDGYDDVVKFADGGERPVRRPFKLEGHVRMRIAENLSILKQMEENFMAALKGIRLEMNPSGNGELEAGNEEQTREYLLRQQALLDEVIDVRGLVKLKVSWLNMAPPIENPISASALTLLAALLIDDISTGERIPADDAVASA